MTNPTIFAFFVVGMSAAKCFCDRILIVWVPFNHKGPFSTMRPRSKFMNTNTKQTKNNKKSHDVHVFLWRAMSAAKCFCYRILIVRVPFDNKESFSTFRPRSRFVSTKQTKNHDASNDVHVFFVVGNVRGHVLLLWNPYVSLGTL